ncbi:MAG: GNAT family N-acetyltransferase [Actinomycetota bacterium]|nr:GNAT family N-acetyltransferase [Actinomycetota bacterium]
MLSFVLCTDCHLRLFEEADAEELQRLIERNRAHLRLWLPWAAEQTLEGTLRFIRFSRQQVAENNGLQTAIVCSGRIVGVAGFHEVDWKHRSTSIGYWLDREHEGRGIMTRTVRALVDHAVLGWNLNRVEIQTAPDNRRSRAIPERLGFQEEGVLRQVQWVGDGYVDGVVYSILAAEWRAGLDVRKD